MRRNTIGLLTVGMLVVAACVSCVQAESEHGRYIDDVVIGYLEARVNLLDGEGSKKYWVPLSGVSIHSTRAEVQDDGEEDWQVEYSVEVLPMVHLAAWAEFEAFWASGDSESVSIFYSSGHGDLGGFGSSDPWMPGFNFRSEDTDTPVSDALALVQGIVEATPPEGSVVLGADRLPKRQ